MSDKLNNIKSNYSIHLEKRFNFKDTAKELRKAFNEIFTYSEQLEKENEEIRQAFAEYYVSEGCSCCRDVDAHKAAEKIFQIIKDWDIGEGEMKDYKYIRLHDVVITIWKDGSLGFSLEGAKDLLSIEQVDQLLKKRQAFMEEKAFYLEPFDRVLVRGVDIDAWTIDFFECEDAGSYMCLSGVWEQIAPYEGNEKYLDTTEDIPGAWKK